MSTKTIAIIGATGNMGAGLSKALAKNGHQLLLVSRETEKATVLHQEILSVNANAWVKITDGKSAAAAADVVVLAVPYAAEKEVAAELQNELRGKTVVSISNPLNATYDGLVTAPGTSAGEELQTALPDAHVVKAFNTVFAADFAAPVIGGQQADVLIAGNDEAALQTAADVVKAAGFRAVEAGGLPVSRTLESMTLLLIGLTMKHGYNWLAGWKVLHN